MAYLGNSPLNALFNIVPTTLTQGQTTVNVNYTPGRCLFYKNGALLDNGIDYTATNGSTVTMLKQVSQGDVLQCINLSSFNVANAMPLSGGQMSGPLTGPASATETIAGLLPIATTALAQGLVDDASVITPKKLADAFGGTRQSLGGGSGYQKLPGGLIIQWGGFSVSSGTLLSITLPIAFPNNVMSCAAVVGSGAVTAAQFCTAYADINAIHIAVNSGASNAGTWIAIGR